jgi:hypothetical protein
VMYAAGAEGHVLQDEAAATQAVADELTGLAAAASMAATQNHAHALQQPGDLAVSYPDTAAQLDSRTKELIHAHMPGGAAAAMMRMPLPKQEGGVSQQPAPTRKRRQSQARLTQNAEAQKRYRYARPRINFARAVRPPLPRRRRGRRPKRGRPRLSSAVVP